MSEVDISCSHRTVLFPRGFGASSRMRAEADGVESKCQASRGRSPGQTIDDRHTHIHSSSVVLKQKGSLNEDVTVLVV